MGVSSAQGHPLGAILSRPRQDIRHLYDEFDGAINFRFPHVPGNDQLLRHAARVRARSRDVGGKEPSPAERHALRTDTPAGDRQLDSPSVGLAIHWQR